jgi:hypothetical protein
VSLLLLLPPLVLLLLHSTHTELQVLTESERRSELILAGFDEATIETIGLYLSAMPLLNIAVKLEADEDDGDIQQGDVGHCKVGCY